MFRKYKWHSLLVARTAHIHLRNVKDQREHVGWYPLVGNIGQSGISKDPLERIRGSIRLRVQWIYDTPGLVEYYLLCTERRLETLRRRYDGLKRQLKSVQDATQQVREQEESFVSARVPALASLHKRKRGMYSNPTASEVRAEISSQYSKGIRAVTAKDQLKKKIHAARFMMKAKRLSDEDFKNRTSKSSRLENKFADENDEISFGDAIETQASHEWIVDSAASASVVDAYPSNTIESSSTAPTCLPLCPVPCYAQNYINSHYPNGRLLHLRWLCWQHTTNSGVEFSSCPFWTSWNIARLIVNSKAPSPKANATEQGGCDEIDKFLMLPPATPRIIVGREKNDVCELIRSRTLFSKAARRSLGSIFNPGGGEYVRHRYGLPDMTCSLTPRACFTPGTHYCTTMPPSTVLTIRPITALNLPENFTSMFVKLR